MASFKFIHAHFTDHTRSKDALLFQTSLLGLGVVALFTRHGAAATSDDGISMALLRLKIFIESVVFGKAGRRLDANVYWALMKFFASRLFFWSPWPRQLTPLNHNFLRLVLVDRRNLAGVRPPLRPLD